MLRARLPRRALLGAVAAAAVVAPSTSREKLPIYPAPEPQLVLVDAPSELERQIGHVRRTLTEKYSDSYSYVQAWVDRWIDVEHAVERRIKSFKAPDEQLTPGVLYVGVATLSGSILARSRGLPTRLALPPTLLILSLNHFLPQTAANIGAYVSDLEHTYVPRAAQFTDTAVAHSQMTWEMAKDKALDARVSLERGVVSAVGAIQDATGLKLREALGVSRAFGEDVKKAAEERGREAMKVAEEQSRIALQAAEERGKEAVRKIEAGALEVKDAVEKKAEEVKRLV